MRQTSPEIPEDELIVTPQEAEGYVERTPYENGLVQEIKFSKEGKPVSLTILDEDGETLYYANLSSCQKFMAAHEPSVQEEVIKTFLAQQEKLVRQAKAQA